MNEEKMKGLCSSMAAQLPVLRKAMGVTQAQLAWIAGVTRNTIIHIERSRTMGWQTFLSFLMIFSENDNARRLIEAFGLHPAELDDFLAGRTGTEA